MNVTKMNSGYGGAQREMHTKDIKQNFVYLGPHEQIIEVGGEQHMVFQEIINGTLCVPPQEHADTNFSHYDDISLKYKTKADLLGNIKSSSVDISVVKGKMVGELQVIASENLIYVTKYNT